MSLLVSRPLPCMAQRDAVREQEVSSNQVTSRCERCFLFVQCCSMMRFIGFALALVPLAKTGFALLPGKMYEHDQVSELKNRLTIRCCQLLDTTSSEVIVSRVRRSSGRYSQTFWNKKRTDQHVTEQDEARLRTKKRSVQRDRHLQTCQFAIEIHKENSRFVIMRQAFARLQYAGLLDLEYQTNPKACNLPCSSSHSVSATKSAMQSFAASELTLINSCWISISAADETCCLTAATRSAGDCCVPAEPRDPKRDDMSNLESFDFLFRLHQPVSALQSSVLTHCRCYRLRCWPQRQCFAEPTSPKGLTQNREDLIALNTLKRLQDLYKRSSTE